MRESDREILESLTIGDLQEQHQVIAEAVGIDGMLRLSKIFGGNPIYVPEIQKLTRNKRYRMILDEYDGTNVKELSVKYGVCKSTIYNIVKEKIRKGSVKRTKKAADQIDGQLNFADIGIQ